MKKQEKAKQIQKILNRLYPNPPISLDYKNTFTLLVAVVLSAQTTDKIVNKTTPQLFALASTPSAMAKLSVAQIQKIIRPIGLAPSKARALSALSKMLLQDFDGEVPKTLEELIKLPGVGRKTAGVVLTQAFNLPAFPVDTHINRLAKRWGLSKGKTVRQVEEDLKKLFPSSSWRKLHLQMIYFGREYCPAKSHSKKDCPVCSILD